MPRAYSNDLRRKVLEAHAAGRGSYRALAVQFGVSVGWIEKIAGQRRQTGQVERVEQRHGPRSRVSEAVESDLCEQLRGTPDRTLAEWQRVPREKHRLELSVTQIWRVLKRIGLRLKKKSIHRPIGLLEAIFALAIVSVHAAEQDTEEGRKHRQQWREQVAGIAPERLIFLDESGVTTQMTRLYGRAFRGERVREGIPAGRWKTLTLLSAIGVGGLVTTMTHRAVRSQRWLLAAVSVMTVEAPTDGEVFLAYLEQVLCPQLIPGHIVVMDNLAAHKVAGVKRLIEGRRAQLLYLPPYSPDFNPIEKAWAKLKQHLRKLKAKTVEQLQPAITKALPTITPANAQAWFRHCGYVLQE